MDLAGDVVEGEIDPDESPRVDQWPRVPLQQGVVVGTVPHTLHLLTEIQYMLLLKAFGSTGTCTFKQFYRDLMHLINK